MKRLYFSFLVIFVSVYSYGQYGSLPIIPLNGYIIPANGDTLMEKIKYTKLTGNYLSEIRFTDSEGIRAVYRAD